MLNTQENYLIATKLDMRSYSGAGESETEAQIKSMEFHSPRTPPLEPLFSASLGALSDVDRTFAN
jgi:hypothetical protein